MKRRTFIDLLIRGFAKGIGIVVLALGVVSVALGFLFARDLGTIDGAWAWFFATFLITIIVCLFRSAWLIYEESLFASPSVKIISGMEPHSVYENALAMLITEPDNRFTQDAYVSIFAVDKNVEQLIAVGEVIHIQGDKKVQILVTRYTQRRVPESMTNLIERICNNNSDVLDSLLIKPSVTKRLLEVIANG